jgi:hypothetical protein
MLHSACPPDTASQTADRACRVLRDPACAVCAGGACRVAYGKVEVFEDGICEVDLFVQDTEQCKVSDP